MNRFKAPPNVATFFLRIPLSAMFLQQGLSKLPVTGEVAEAWGLPYICLLYTSPSPRDRTRSRMPSSA